jgi:hypothetical protein
LVVGFFLVTVVFFTVPADVFLIVVFFLVVWIEPAETRVECLGRLCTTFFAAASDVDASAKMATMAISSNFIDLRIM